MTSMVTLMVAAQPAAFFATTGYYHTAPGSTLSVVIQPNYYDAIVRALPSARPAGCPPRSI